MKKRLPTQSYQGVHDLQFDRMDIRNGGRGIRTPAGCDTPSGFRNRPLQPDLGIPPYENGAYRIRTDDLLRAGQALSQLS